MSKQKHTPGPWKVSRGEPAVIAQDDEVVATCYLFRGSDEDYANARLIAAAPTYDKVARMVVREDYLGLLAFAKEHDCMPPGIAHNCENALSEDLARLTQACLRVAIDKAEGDQ